MRPFFVFQKFGHAVVARARNQAFAALHHYLQRQAEGGVGVDDVQKREGVVVEIFAVMAGGHNDGIHFGKG